MINNKKLFKYIYSFQKLFRWGLVFLFLFLFLVDFNNNFLLFFFLNRGIIFNYLVLLSCLAVGVILILYVFNEKLAVKLSLFVSTIMLTFIFICNYFFEGNL